MVGLEESVGTDRATALALEIAQAQGARLMGLTIVDEPDITAGAAMGIGGSSYKLDRDKTLMEEAHRRAHEAEELFLLRCRKASVAARVLEITVAFGSYLNPVRIRCISSTLPASIPRDGGKLSAA